MNCITRLVLDILKPHEPGVLEFSRLLAEQGGIRVKTKMEEMDEQTETLEVVIEGSDIDFERIQAAIGECGASLHSVDEVEVESTSDSYA